MLAVGVEVVGPEFGVGAFVDEVLEVGVAHAIINLSTHLDYLLK